MSKPPVTEQVQVNFRMPVDLRDAIREAALRSGRSMNAEIIMRLEATFTADNIEQWQSLQRERLAAAVDRQKQDAASLAGVMDELVDEISTRIIANLRNDDAPPSSPLGRAVHRRKIDR